MTQSDQGASPMQDQTSRQIPPENKLSLAHAVLSDEAATVEDLVREMLRPMLKAWLEDNLPGIVERLVCAEIERMKPRQ